MELDLTRVRAFVAAAGEPTFTRAAQALGISQPSLSERIRRLEDDLGVALFDRAHRRAVLTPAGRALLDRAGPLLAAADDAVAATRAAADAAPPDRFVITTLAAGIDELKAGLLVAVRRAAPELAVSLTPTTFADHLRGVAQGRADAAFVWPPYDPAALHGLAVHPVRRCPRLLAVAAGHPVAAASRADAARLRDLPQVPVAGDVDPVFAAAWRVVADPPLAAVPPVSTVGALLDAVAAGHGCAPVPDLLARTSARPDVAFVPLTGAGPAVLALAWREADPRHRLLARVAREAAREAA